jgi:hypothetical protein
MTWSIKRGDALDAMRAMPTASVGCVITDPPEPEKDAPRPFLASVLAECLRVSSGPVVWLGVPIADGRNSHGPFDSMPQWIAHWAVTLGDRFLGMAPVYAWNVSGASIDRLCSRDNVIYGDMSGVAPSPRHAGEKPLMLGLGLMNHFAVGSVLDPFCGTGTFGAAAVLAGHDFAGIDRVKAYVESAREKIAGVEVNGLVLTQEVEA